MMNFTFKPTLIPTLAFILILPCLIALGFWQLDRAAQKEAMLTGLEHSRTDEPLTLEEAVDQLRKKPYYGVKVTGEFLPHEELLLMHASEQGQPGYYVLSTLQTEYKNQKAYLLVNRGFISASAYEHCHQTPGCPLIPEGALHKGAIYGIISQPQPTRFILGETIPDRTARPLMVQRTDLKAIEAVTGKTYLPLVVLANSDLHDGFIRDWQIVVMPPEKHIGYAVQWFALSLCLIIIYIVVNVRRRL